MTATHGDKILKKVSHPPHRQMAIEAITALKTPRKGVSQPAILKWIIFTYHTDPGRYLLRTLKTGVENGTFEKMKGSYKLGPLSAPKKKKNRVEGRTPEKCPDCQVKPGKPHIPGCDVERCTECKRQRLQCLWVDSCPSHDPKLAQWMGEWPGLKECREKNWWCVMIPGSGWTQCSADHPGATEDLNRLALYNSHSFKQN